MSDFDTNLENYSKEDLMTIFDIEPHNSKEEVEKKSNDYLNALVNEHPEIIEFLQRAQKKLIETHNLSIEEGNKNPIKREVHYKYLSIDSRFRQNNSALANQSEAEPVENIESSNTETSDFLLNLSETLKNVTRLKFYSAHIPFSWYNVYEPINVFTVQVGAAAPAVITVTPGNYVLNNTADPENILKALNDLLPATIDFTYSTIRGKVEMENKTAQNVIINFLLDENTNFKDNTKINNTIATILGYKKNKYTLSPAQKIESEGFPNIRRTKYLIIEINDYNKNNIANKLVYGSDRYEVFSLPNYYTTLKVKDNDVPESSLNGECVEDNLKNSGVVDNSKKVPLYNESYPRKMTQNQIYSLNELLKARVNNKSLVQQFTSSPNYFAFVPVDLTGSGLTFGDILVYDNDSEMLNERIYFGPVDIERINVRVLDENGNQLDLNGAEWSMMVIVEHLYQY